MSNSASTIALIIVAAIFASGPYSEPGKNEPRSYANSTAHSEKPPKTFGEKTTDDPIATFTAMLVVVFSAVLAGVAIVQIHFLTKADRTSRIAAEAAKKSAVAALKSANVAELALVGTEAPFIIANVEFHVATVLGTHRTILTGACYSLHNYGKSPAIVREVYISCVASGRIPNPIPFPPLQSQLFKVMIIAAGKSNKGEPLNGVEVRLRDDIVFVIGQVRYADVNSNQYISGFCFALNESSSTFYLIGGVAHNYRRKLNEDEVRFAEARDMIPPRST